MKTKNLVINVWDWVVLKDGRVIQIDHDEMMGVSYEDIERHALNVEIKQQKKINAIDSLVSIKEDTWLVYIDHVETLVVRAPA